MKTELVHFETADSLRLPGLLYEPSSRTKTAVIYLHGCGSSSVFYKPEMNLYARKFTDHSVSFFPFNNRGAHYQKNLTNTKTQERMTYGTWFELMKDSVLDIDGVIRYLTNRGFDSFFLMGESTGANKIVLYDWYRPKNPVLGYALLSGGDDTGLHYEAMGERTYTSALKRAQEMIRDGKGMQKVPRYINSYGFSWQSLYDVLNPEGDYNMFPFKEFLHKIQLSKKLLFREFSKIEKPTCVIYGEHDEFCYGNVTGCVNTLKQHVSKKNRDMQFHIIPNTGHSFEGAQEQVAQILTRWVSSNLRLPRT